MLTHRVGTETVRDKLAADPWAAPRLSGLRSAGRWTHSHPPNKSHVATVQRVSQIPQTGEEVVASTPRSGSPDPGSFDCLWYGIGTRSAYVSLPLNPQRGT